MDSEPSIPLELLHAYSRGQVTRREIGQQMDQPVGFGSLLAALHAARLPLPRISSTSRSKGAELVRRLAERSPTRAG